MSIGEVPSFNPEIPATGTSTPENKEFPQDAELTEKLLLLRDTLDAHKQADAISYSFKFYGDSLDSESIYLPGTVHDLVRQYGAVDSVEVCCNYLEGSGGTSLVVVFGLYDEKTNDTTYLQLNRPYNYVYHKMNSDRLYRDDPDEETFSKGSMPINEKDLNRCLASLVYGNPDINIAAFDTFSWADRDFTKLIDDFKETANDYLGEYEFLFTDSKGGPAGMLGYQEQDGTVIDIEIYRVVQQFVDISTGGNLGYYEKSIEAAIDPSSPDERPFLCEHHYTDDKKTTTIIDQANFDYQATFDFIDQQIADCDPLPSN